MTLRTVLALAVFAGLGGNAFAANMCQAGKLTCSTAMPVGGYCECTSGGNTANGTVVSEPAPRTPPNAASGGCGANPAAPGCR